MKKTLIAAAATAAAFTAAPAFAQTWDNVDVYGSLGYAHYDEDVTLGAVQGRLGLRFGSYFGVEGEGAFGVSDDDIGGVDAELNRQLAIYGVGYIPINENFDIIGRVGVGNTEFEVGGVDFDDDSVNYGVGAQWRWDEKNGIRGDWTRYDFDAGGDADVWSLSYVRKF